MSQLRASLLVLASALALTVVWVDAQTVPKLAAYYTQLLPAVLDPGYSPTSIAYSSVPVTEDLNGDGHLDLVVMGGNYPGGEVINVPQPGRVFLGDGAGHFVPASTDLFPVDTLMTVHPRKVLFADFNADGRPDMFVSAHGWDQPPGPGEQNRLYLSTPEGGWRDATANLPQLSDYSHTSAVGDISGRGVTDIFVGNGFAALNKIRPYTLLNTGSGQFVQTTTNIPVGDNQLLDPASSHSFAGATLTDLNGDGLPELIVTGNTTGSFDKIRNTTILWNRAGVFLETDTTKLPQPAPFSSHSVYDVKRIDANQDGLPDLVIVGKQGGLYGGWFVQILINRENRQFVDETTERVPPGEAYGGPDGVPNTAPTASWVQVLDFNHDGAPDFSVEFGFAAPRSPDQPIIWLNDGTGHFSTLKMGDFVAAGRETFLGSGHLMATVNGYSFARIYQISGGGLGLQMILASKPYRITPAPSALRH